MDDDKQMQQPLTASQKSVGIIFVSILRYNLVLDVTMSVNVFSEVINPATKRKHHYLRYCCYDQLFGKP